MKVELARSGMLMEDLETRLNASRLFASFDFARLAQRLNREETCHRSGCREACLNKQTVIPRGLMVHN